MTMFRDLSPEQEPPREVRPATRVWWRERRVLGIAGAIVVIIVVVLLWRSCHKTAAPEETNVEVSVQVAKAERGTIAREVAAVATLVPQREATLSPKIAAQIAQMPLLTNRRVRAGDVLAVLESRDLAAQRAEAAAAVTEAETTAHTTANGAIPITNAQDSKAVRDARANLDTQEKTYERRKVLFEQGGISKKDLEARTTFALRMHRPARITPSRIRARSASHNRGSSRHAIASAISTRNLPIASSVRRLMA